MTWSLTSPKIYSQQARDSGEWWFSSNLSPQAWEPGEPVVYFRSESLLAWDLQKANVQFESKGRKNTNFPSQGSQTGGSCRRRVCLFVLFRSSPDWMRPTYIGKGNLLYPFYQMQMFISFRRTLTDTPSIMSDQVSGHPMAQSSQYLNYHTTLSMSASQIEISDEICLLVRERLSD